MQSIGVSIRQDADFVIPQFAQIIRIWVNANGNGDIMNLLTGKHGIGRHFPGIQDFAPKRHDGLKMSVTRLFGAAPC